MNNFILNTLDSHNSFKKIVDNISKNSSPVLATGVIDAVKTHLIASLLENHAKTSLVITSSELKAKEIVADLQFFIKNREILFYPAKDIIFYSADVRSIDITKTRFAALNSVLNGEKPIVVLSIEALFDRLTPRKNFEKSIITLNVGEEYNLSELAEKFIFLGYERVSTVEAPGQFSLRGGIIDLCTIIGSQAVRIEFFGDEVDSIRQLDLITQRSFDKLEEIKIFPMRELVYGDEELQQAITLIEEEFDKTHKNLEKKGLYEKASKLKSEILESCERLKTEKRVLGVEKFTKYFYENSETLVDYLDQNSFIYFDEPTRILGKAISSQEEFNESIKNRIL
ncbi:MAG: transcription-repair coupling factor, partial [Defluviitaleaceae bacterium]|nr:transcription-repair coupling factor [Defluviitaleaceae bacterium]